MIKYLWNDSLVKNLILKKELLEADNPDHQKIRPVLFISGGGMGGVFSTGVAIAFHELGLHQTFDVVAGASTGACVGAYFLGDKEKAYQGASAYYQECCEKKFFDFFRKEKRADPGVVRHVFKQGPKALDVQRVLDSRPEFFVAGTCVHGKTDFINVKTCGDPLEAIFSSFAIPGYSRPVKINGCEYFDGASQLPLPAKRLIDEFNPTDLWILMNYNTDHSDGVLTSLVEGLVFLDVYERMPSDLKEAVWSRHSSLKENLDYLKELKDINVGVLMPTNNAISFLMMNSKKLKDATYDSARQTLEIFGRPELDIKLL